MIFFIRYTLYIGETSNMSRALCRGILYLSLKLNHLYQISYTLNGFMLKSQIYDDVNAAFSRISPFELLSLKTPIFEGRRYE